jgi:glycosyltransferase involved in cell wall biosynthesis
MLKKNLITIVIPCYNERQNLPKLFNKINKFQKKNKNFSFIIVENGSTDKSYDLLKRLTKKNNKNRYFKNQEKYWIWPWNI